MRDINAIKKDFKTEGNTNGHYQQLEKNVSANANARFQRKPWYLQAAENLKRLREEKGD